MVNPFSCQADLLEARICFHYSTVSALWTETGHLPFRAGLSGIFLKPSLIHQLVVFAFFYLLLIILLRLSRIFTYIYNIHRINTQLYAYQVKLGEFFLCNKFLFSCFKTLVKQQLPVCCVSVLFLKHS